MTGLPPELPPWWLWDQLDLLPPALHRRLRRAATESQTDQRIPADVLPAAPTGPERPQFTGLPPTLEARPQVESIQERTANRRTSILEALQRERERRAQTFGPRAAGFVEGVQRTAEPIAAAFGNREALESARARRALEQGGFALPSEHTEVAAGGEAGPIGKALGARTAAETGEIGGVLAASAPAFMAGGEVAQPLSRLATRGAVELGLPGPVRAAVGAAAQGAGEFGVGSALQAGTEEATAGGTPKEIIQRATVAGLAGATSPLALIHVPGATARRVGVSRRVAELKGERAARMTGDLVPGAVRVPPEPRVPGAVETTLTAVGEEPVAALAGAAVGGAVGAQGPDEGRTARAIAGAVTGAVAGPHLRRAGERLAPGEAGHVGPVPRPAPLAPDVSEFRSRMRDAITNAPFSRGTAEQWRAHLSKGVNQAELKDTGLGQFLDERRGQVLDRDAVLAAGQPTHVSEVQFGPLGGDALARDLDTQLEQFMSPQDARRTRQRIANHPTQYDEYLPAGIGPAHPLVTTAAQFAEHITTNRGNGRYAEYTLPGGQNYREIVLTAPPAAKPPLAVGDRVGTPSGAVGHITELDPENYATVQTFDGTQIRVAGRSLAREGDLATAPTFTSSHWPGVENPVAHIRLTDRTTPDGQKVTFLEEIQSDVHEQGRELGYAENLPAGATRSLSGQPPRLPFSRTEDWVGLAVRRALAEAVATGSDRLAWTTGVQQAGRYSQALQRGLDGVRWRPGYDRADGVLQYKRHGSTEWQDYDTLGEGDLPGVVGRDVADRLLADQPVQELKVGTEVVLPNGYHGVVERVLPGGALRVRQSGNRTPIFYEVPPQQLEPANWRTVTGTDLVIGGQGMRTFYDQIVPRVVTDYLKKIGVRDVQVQDAQMGAGGPKAGRVTPEDIVAGVREVLGERAGFDFAHDLSPEGWGGEEPPPVEWHRGNFFDTWGGGAYSDDDLLRAWRAALRYRKPGAVTGTTVHSIPITPDLKAKIQSGEGTYLYSGLDPGQLKNLPPEAIGAVAGGAVGAATGDDTKDRLGRAAIGATLGAVGARNISTALRERRARARAEAMRETPPLEASGAAPVTPDLRVQPAGINVPSVRAEPHVLAGREKPINVDDYVNLAKFDTDPAGTERLKMEVARVVQNTGLAPKQVVPWAETRRLASQLGIDLDDKSIGSVNRRLDGPTMLAIRNIISANVEALERLAQRRAPLPEGSEPAVGLDRQIHQIESQNARLLERFIRSRSQTGRDLNNMKIVANRTLEPTLWLSKATQLAGRDLTADEITTISRLAEQRDRAGLVRYVANLRQSTAFEKLTTLWKAGLLTNPKTHVVNIVSNTTMAALEAAKDPVAALADRLLSLTTGVRTKGGWSSQTLPAGLRGAVEGFREARATLRGEPTGDALAKYDLPRDTNFDNVFLDTYTKTVFRLLGAEDRVFWWAAFRRSVAEQATVAGRQAGLRGVKLRDYVADAQKGRGLLADEITTQGMADADLTTFRDRTALGDIAAYAARRLKPLEFIIPFRRTPAAVATSVLRFSPAGLGKAAVWDLPRFLTAVAQGKDQIGGVPLKVVQRQLAEAVGRGTVGSAAIWLGWLLAKNGNATGAAPTTGTKERQQWLQENRQANSVKIGDTWYQVGRISPVGNLIALGANLRAIWGPEGAERTPQERYAEVVASGLRTVADQPFVTGVSQALNALQEPEREAARFAQGMEASAVPAIVGAAARGLDPTARMRTGPTGPILERIPGLRTALPPQVTPLGEPVQRGPTSQPAALLNAMFNPLTASPDLRASDPLIKELADAGYAVPRLPQAKGEGSITYTRRQQLYGRTVRAALEATVQSPAYQALQAQEQQLQQEAARLAATPGWDTHPVEQIQRALEDAMKASTAQPVTRAEALQRVVTQVRAQLTRALVPQR